jgi:hypothetical protein
MATVVVETAQPLFHGMIISIFWAAVSFFDTTPSSRILNRVRVVCYIHRSIKLYHGLILNLYVFSAYEALVQVFYSHQCMHAPY